MKSTDILNLERLDQINSGEPALVLSPHLAIQRRDFLTRSTAQGAQYFDNHFAEFRYDTLRDFARNWHLTYKWQDIVDLAECGMFDQGESILAVFAQMNEIQDFDEEAFVRGFVSRAREIIRWIDETVPLADFILEMSDECLEKRIASAPHAPRCIPHSELFRGEG